MRFASDRGVTFFCGGPPNGIGNLMFMDKFLKTYTKLRTRVFFSIKGAFGPDLAPDGTPKRYPKGLNNVLHATATLEGLRREVATHASTS
jgi:hypothetical protein